jgi:hypothetical protein
MAVIKSTEEGKGLKLSAGFPPGMLFLAISAAFLGELCG